MAWDWASSWSWDKDCCDCCGSGGGPTPPTDCRLLLEDGTSLLLLETGDKILLEMCEGGGGGGCTNVGALGNICDVATLVWHVECEYQCYANLTPLTPCGNGDDVVQWTDLVAGVNNLTPLATAGGGRARYGTGATSTGRPNIQVGSDFNVVLQGSFNFFTGNGKWSYAVIFRQTSTHMALVDDGTPFTNGFAAGYGNGDMETSGTPSTIMGIKDGAGTTEDTGIGKNIIGAVVATYDGTLGGATIYYFIRGGVGMEPPVVVEKSSTFTQLGLTASGGFALAGTFGNSDPNRRDTSCSLMEAAVWQGVLSDANVDTIGSQILAYWGLN